jgi:CheY-like chemotaxis protein
MNSYVCRILVVDDGVTEAALRPNLLEAIGDEEIASRIDLKICQTIHSAFSALNIKEDELDKTEEIKMTHEFDIVLLDFQFSSEEMEKYPMGGFMLEDLFLNSFRKPWACLVQKFSTRTGDNTKYKNARLLTDLSKRSAPGGRMTIETKKADVSKINWRDIFEKWASVVLKSAPLEVHQEIAAQWALDNHNFWSKSLNSLATFVGVKSCSLNNLFLKKVSPTDPGVVFQNLLSILSEKSLCESTWNAYQTELVGKFAHRAASKVKLDTALQVTPPSIIDDKTVWPIAPSLANDLELISENSPNLDGQERCYKVHEAFRLCLFDKSYRPRQGYTIDQVIKLDGNILPYVIKMDFNTETLQGSVYIYIHLRDLNDLLQGLGAIVADFKPVTECGKYKCNIRILQHRGIVLFVLAQQTIINFNDVGRIASSIGKGKSWGPFPKVLNWGTIWVGIKGGATLSLIPDYSYQVSLSQDTPLSPGEIALVLPYKDS